MLSIHAPRAGSDLFFGFTAGILDYKTYENDGNWYVFLDEAHRGDSENSNLKDYVNRLSTNGFLFNFSATFIDAIFKWC